MNGPNSRTSLRILLITCLIIPLIALPVLSEPDWGNPSTALVESAGPEYSVNLPGGWNIFSTPVLLDSGHEQWVRIWAGFQEEIILVQVIDGSRLDSGIHDRIKGFGDIHHVYRGEQDADSANQPVDEAAVGG